MREKSVVITGMGVVSAFGPGVDRFWNALLEGRSAMRPIEGFDPSPYRSPLGAEVPSELYRDREAIAACGSPREAAALFSAIAAREALADAGLGPVFDDAQRVGGVLGSLCAGGRELARVIQAFADGEPPPEDLDLHATMVQYQLDFLAERHNLTGPSALVSTACASSTDAIGYAADLIEQGDCDIVLAGGGDVLVEFIHGGFNALYSITQSAPKPFDRSRDGFVIGEGAAIFVLESEASAIARGARIRASVLGYGLSNTAFHITATSEDGRGEGLAVLRALEDAGLDPRRIGYINAHGTSTRHNDATEALAIRFVFGSHAPAIAVNSIKPAIGHCMGAAGALEAVATVLALEHQCVPPTSFTAADEEGAGVDLVVGAPRAVRCDYAMSESFGFGGACSCVVLGRHRPTGHAA